MISPNTLILELCADRLVPGCAQSSVKWAFQLCSGLTAVHYCGFIHRDINPNNLLLCGDELRITDFGDAVLESESDTRPVGTIAYMAPEVLSGLPQTCALDVWSAGMTIFYLFTGRMLLKLEEGRDKLALAMFAIHNLFHSAKAGPPQGVDARMWSQLEPMLAFDAERRIMAADACDRWEMWRPR